MRHMRSGFTIIEAVVSIAVLGIVVAFLVPAFIGNLQTNTTVEERQQAITIARSTMERIRRVDPGGLPISGTDPATNVTLGSRQYSVTTTYCGISSLCSASARYVEVEVSLNGREVYAIETIYTQLETSGN
jgi:prepilin-type N-terminal cleavage/methylation domain-containing protein